MNTDNEHGAAYENMSTHEHPAAHNHIPVRDHIGSYDHTPVHEHSGSYDYIPVHDYTDTHVHIPAHDAGSHGSIPVHDYTGMYPRESCPCEAVRELKTIVERHERELALGSTSFALIKQDLEHIKAALEKKDRFNTGLLSSIANIILSILLGWLAVRLGISG